MAVPSSLAFVDVETTGLSPSEDRVAEIGVVTVDGLDVERWGTLLRTPGRRGPLDSALDTRVHDDHDDAPAFSDIADALARRLAGRLFVAHNARFDHAFLHAEFARVGIPFEPQIVCSVMLSRALEPELTHHNLDALAQAHRLTVEERHRALPDAELLWQWWQSIRRVHQPRTIERRVATLLTGPTLPPALDPALLDRMPARPGAYVLHGAGGPLAVGAAANLRLHLGHYFRVGRATTRALENAHRVTDITWRPARGIVGARLEAAALDALHFPQAARRRDAPLFTWRLLPHAVPCVALVSLESMVDEPHPTYGLFATERKARNALLRLAAQHRLSGRLLGFESDTESANESTVSTKKELLRIFAALRTLAVPAWPHAGPIGIRERGDLHVVDRWRYLGTARSEHELHAVLENRAPDFDIRMFRLLRRTLASTPSRRIVELCPLASRERVATT